MHGGTAMAKAKGGAAKAGAKPDPDEMVTRALKMRREYADWLERFAAMERVSLAALLDRALASHALRQGFQVPPDRVP
jgi:hypothetical protein